MVEYRASLPEQNDNVSHNHPLKEFAILLSGVSGFLLLVFWLLSLLVDWAAGYISPEMEARIFSPVHTSGGEVLGKEDDPRQAELQRLVDALGSCVEVGYPLKINLVKSETPNAFAVPGGRIVVLSALLDKVQSENGLVYILAHEMAHFKNRDHLRGLGRQLVLTALSALLTGVGSDLTQLFTPTVQFGWSRYSRERESMADRTALHALHCSYGHVGGATEFFEAMKPEEEGKDVIKMLYFSSHPEAVQRINDLYRWASSSGFPVQKVRPLPAILTDSPEQ